MSDNKKDDKQNKMRLIWDDSEMQMHYANVCNVSSTKEEFNLLFGTNQSWAMGQPSVRIALHNRVVLNPHAAKRLSLLLNNAVSRYEEAMGPIDLDLGNQQPEMEVETDTENTH